METTLRGGMILPTLVFILCIVLVAPVAFLISNFISSIVAGGSTHSSEALVSVLNDESNLNHAKAHR